MVICMYNEHDSEARAAAHAEYVAATGYQALVAEAASRGYRHATLSEIHASAECLPHVEELFCWKGGPWVKA